MGEISPLCWLFGHKWVIDHERWSKRERPPLKKAEVVCERCGVPDPELSEEEARQAVHPLGNVYVLKKGGDE